MLLEPEWSMCVYGGSYFDDGEPQDKHVQRRCAALSPNGHSRDPAWAGSGGGHLRERALFAYDTLKRISPLELLPGKGRMLHAAPECETVWEWWCPEAVMPVQAWQRGKARGCD